MFGNPTEFLKKAKDIDKLSPETISKVKSALEVFESLDNAKDEIRRVSAASASCLEWVSKTNHFSFAYTSSRLRLYLF